MTNYRVIVRDNFHFMDSSEQYESGVFENYDQALTHSKRIVDEFLVLQLKPEMAKEDLYQLYTSFGDDPFIVPESDDGPFSAWEYAKTRCRQICEEEWWHDE